jgi:lipopolysaccharide/colanic/teichoic acid biosynthesis glycosyltransferase
MNRADFVTESRPLPFGRRAQLVLKRGFDLVVAAGALVLLSPLIALISLAIKLDDAGPIMFVQDRVGRGRRKFRCYKFRTMVFGAEARGQGQSVGPEDSRITRVGRYLRMWTLDEVPQLFNVLKGDMSIVGPRAWVPEEAAFCSPSEGRRFSFRPGMAGWAWIHGRNRLPWNERISLDLWYVDHWSFFLDLYILAKAAVLLLRREGVYGAESTCDSRGTEAGSSR